MARGALARCLAILCLAGCIGSIGYAMATIAGYKAVLLAAGTLPRMFPLLTTAAGTMLTCDAAGLDIEVPSGARVVVVLKLVLPGYAGPEGRTRLLRARRYRIRDTPWTPRWLAGT